MSSSTMRAAYAKHILHKYVLHKYNKRYNDDRTTLPSRTLRSPPESGTQEERLVPLDARIGIVGGGVAGLVVALALGQARYENIEILEASKVCGGRCYTYNFTNGPSGQDCPHNYYDVGAMRIPKISTMQSTFDLITLLTSKLYGQTIPLADYVYNAGTEPNMYAYGQINPNTDPASEAFDSLMYSILSANNFLSKEVKFDDAFWAFVNPSDPTKDHPDKYSTRAYLVNNGWSYGDIERAETLDTSTGLFDQAFMETLCDYFDFHQAEADKVDWKRLDGGMSVLPKALENVVTRLGVKVTTSAPVTALSASDDTMTVSFDPTSGQPARTYDVVFNTTSFGCLQRMDLQGLSLDADQLTAIRALSYDRATKVAIKFKQAWWMPTIAAGGVSGTDLPISNVVYPSWNDGDKAAYVGIMSYSWALDATHMASLIAANDEESTNIDDPIVQLLFQNIVKLWSTTSTPITLQTLQENYIAHHSFAWSHAPNTAGGFALFGPGQFENMYPLFTQPLCGNKLWICGEAMSCHHAWISGAIDSAYQAVAGFLKGNNDVTGIDELKDSGLGLGKGRHVAELDENLLFWHVELAEHGVKTGA